MIQRDQRDIAFAVGVNTTWDLQHVSHRTLNTILLQARVGLRQLVARPNDQVVRNLIWSA